MYKHLQYLLLCIATLYPVSIHAATPQEQLQKADGYRLPSAVSYVETKVSVYENDKLDQEREYGVYIKPGRRTLVVMRSPMEKGQKVLMLDDNFWIVMPKSRRPIRITPLQRLLGRASVGDIATLTWSEDYEIVHHEQRTRNEKPMQYLELKAIRKGLSYARIELYLHPSTFEPLEADFYLASGKKAKRATFKQALKDGVLQTVSMTLTDTIQASKRTEIEYLSIEPTEIPEKYFNPAFLTTNSLADL